MLMLVILISEAHAHPGHSSFGSADEEPGWFAWVWGAVILSMSVYGAWRLYRTFRVKRPAQDTEH